MPDSDEFDPIGKDWQRAYDLAVAGADSDQVADEMLRSVTRMLRKSMGCAVFRQLEEALKHLWRDLSTESRDVDPSSAHAAFEAALDEVIRQPGVSERRIDVVANRSARIIGVQLLHGTYRPEREAQLGTVLGVQIVRNLMCHRGLDAARANGVGQTWATHEAAHGHHDWVLARAEEGVQRIGRMLANEPEATNVRRLRVVPKPDMAALMFGLDISLDGDLHSDDEDDYGSGDEPFAEEEDDQ